MANPKPMPARGGASGLDLAASFPVGSPIAQSIIADDLAECSGDEVFADDNLDDDLRDGPRTGPVLYKQPTGVAFDYRRPSMVSDVGEPALTKDALQKSRDAERSLLRDNHLLPPKHAPENRRGVFSTLCRAIFSTKVRRPPPDEEVPSISFEPSESSPLLPGDPGPATPDAEQVDAQWEAAIAHGVIETTWQREAKTIASYAPPLILTFLLQYSINITSIFTVGRIGKVELGAVTPSKHNDRKYLLLFLLSGPRHEFRYPMWPGVRVWPQAPGRPAAPAYDVLPVAPRDTHRRALLALW